MDRCHGWDKCPQCSTMHTHNAMQRAQSGLGTPHMRVPFIKNRRGARAKTAFRGFDLFKWCIEIWGFAADCHRRARLWVRACVRVCVPFGSACQCWKPLTWKAPGRPWEPRSALGWVPWAGLLTDDLPSQRLDSGFVRRVWGCFEFTSKSKKKDKRAISPLFIRSEAAPEEARFQILGTAVFWSLSILKPRVFTARGCGAWKPTWLITSDSSL